MRLLTQEIINQFRKNKEQKDNDPIVIAKFFNPSGSGTWYATEYNEKTRIFYGYVSLFGDHNDEWGSFSLDELEEFVGNFNMRIERDKFFKPQRNSLICSKAVK